jgi:hypothetical protein
MRLLSVVLETGFDGRWHPGIGDPTPLGWFTVAAYLGAAYLAWAALTAARAAAASLATQDPHERRLQLQLAQFWGLACLVMLALGINKQLDLQTWLTQVGRDMAQAQGWYERRHHYQLRFVFSILIAGCMGTLALGYWFRRVLPRLLGGLLGLGVIASFVVIRAASFHHIDALLKGPLQLNWVLELTGIALVGGSALRGARGSRDSSRSRERALTECRP